MSKRVTAKSAGHVAAPQLARQNAELLPFLPMLYVAWADGVLAPSEMAAVQQKMLAQAWLPEGSKRRLANWLDPANPPSAAQMHEWLALIRQARDRKSPPGRQTLVQLGLEMARINDQDSYRRCSTPEACAALEEIEAALGIIGAEATGELLRPAPPRAEAELPPPAFEVEALQVLLDGPYADIRNKVRHLLSDPTFRYEYGLDTATYRRRVYDWCQELARQGLGALAFPEAYGGAGDMGRFIAVFETLAFHDLSLTVKFGVQFGLFGGSILNLGTEPHHQKYLRDTGSLKLPGCFAMTERGHGSNVRDLETTATYDAEKQEFVIHTPNDAAHKEYIGNAAVHGRLATVFAQLIVGGENYGVHALLVPIRDDDGRAMPGVRLEDSGEKMGLNGVDNGRIWFDRVRVPRENLLNRFAEVSPEGHYDSPINSDSKRFFTMLGTLVGGRISVAAAALSAAKSGLTIAIRYANRRRQFGAAGEPESLLLDYPSHQRKLLLPLANVYALDFALKHLVQRYLQRSDDDAREVEALAAGLKAWGTWNTTKTLQICREACGGQGYMAVNRFAALKADTDVFTTFEGDNTVLLQLVARGLLTQFKQQFSEMKFFGMVKYMAGQTATAITEMNPLVTRRTDPEHLRSREFLLSAFEYREQDLLASAARRLKKRLDDGLDSFVAFSEVQDHLVNLATAHVERVLLQQFLDAIDACDDAGVAEMLTAVATLFGLARLEADRGWFQENNYIEGGKAKAIRQEVEALCRELRPQAESLTAAFAIPEACLAAPIATGDGR